MDYVGIDPGIKGAIASQHIYIDGFEDTRNIEIWPMPTYKVKKGKKQKELVDFQALTDLLTKLQLSSIQVKDPPPDDRPWVVEEQSAMPGDGARSMGAVSAFTLGYNYAIVIAALEAVNHPYVVTRAKDWQRVFRIAGGGDRTKVQSVQLVQQEFPDVGLLRTPRSRTLCDGMADALLMSEYARRGYK